jgi:predicted transcriptional regulator
MSREAPIDGIRVFWEYGNATLDISDELYRAIKVEAARTDRSVREIIEEALERWLEATEDAEDITASDAAMAEYDRDGGIDAREVFGNLAAEHAAAYDTRPR